jgi:DNA-binding transcriptional regulator YdaS (Cro superfamily)
MSTDDALNRALALAGSKAALAAACGVKGQTVNQWFKHERDVPPPRAWMLEQKFGIDCRWFRPDDWQKHWPHIVGTPIRPLPVAPEPVTA